MGEIAVSKIARNQVNRAATPPCRVIWVQLTFVLNIIDYFGVDWLVLLMVVTVR